MALEYSIYYLPTYLSTTYLAIFHNVKVLVFFFTSIMVDDLLLVLLTIKALWPPSMLPSWLADPIPDWSASASMLLAAYRLASVISALLQN